MGEAEADNSSGGGGGGGGGGEASAVPKEDSWWPIEVVHKEKETGVLETSFNFINSIIGAGIIGLPFAMQEAGLPLGIILLLLVAVLTAYSIYLLVHTGKLCDGLASYPSLVYRAYGPAGYIFVSVFMFMFPFGAMLAYLIIIGDTVPLVLRHYLGVHFFTNRQFIIAVAMLFIIFPLSLLRRIGFLAKASFLSLICVMFIIFAVCLAYALGEGDNSPSARENAYNFAHPSFFQAIGVIAFAFVCHHNSIMLYNSLQKRSEARWTFVTILSVGTSLVASLVMAVVGYLAYKQNTDANILNNFPVSNVLINVARLLFAVTMVLTFPIEHFVSREVVDMLLFGRAKPNWPRSIAWTLLLCSITLLIALLTDDLGAVLDLSGGFSATAVAFVFPGLCYIKVASPKLDKLYWVHIFGAIFLVIFGGVTLVMSTTFTILNIAGVMIGDDDDQFFMP